MMFRRIALSGVVAATLIFAGSAAGSLPSSSAEEVSSASAGFLNGYWIMNRTGEKLEYLDKRQGLKVCQAYEDDCALKQAYGEGFGKAPESVENGADSYFEIPAFSLFGTKDSTELIFRVGETGKQIHVYAGVEYWWPLGIPAFQKDRSRVKVHETIIPLESKAVIRSTGAKTQTHFVLTPDLLK